MHILLVGGFLGSGKTTTILQIASYLTTVRRETVVIIENEIGAAGIDDKLFVDNGLKVKKLFGGCVCCQITSDLIGALADIHTTMKPDWVMIEMTGLAYPAKTAMALKKYSKVYSTFKIITIVDRGRWSELTAMLKPLVEGQLTGSNLVILNKVDLAGETLEKICGDIREIDENMKVVTASARQPLSIPVLEEVVCCEH